MEDTFDRGRYHTRAFNLWMHKPFFDNPHMLPDRESLFDVVRVKYELWNRYRLFYDVDTIREVFPDNEIAQWVIDARLAGRRAEAIFRDSEMSYERSNEWCEVRWPRRMRSYEEELKVQARQKFWRTASVYWRPSSDMYYEVVMKKIYEGEELPRCLVEEDERVAAEHRKFWERRRNPVKEQHDAGIPDPIEWEKFCRERELEREVRLFDCSFIVHVESCSRLHRPCSVCCCLSCRFGGRC